MDKVYFEGFTFDQVEEYLYPALQNVKDLNSFFDILFNVIKDYANVSIHLLSSIEFLNGNFLMLGSQRSFIREVERTISKISICGAKEPERKQTHASGIQFI